MDTITFFTIIGSLFVFIVAAIAIDIYMTSFCRNCGTKMNRYYDPEEDAEVYQCPKCGRSYLIK